MTSSPRWQWLIRAARLDCVPVGNSSAASKPNSAAACSCRRLTVGSSPKTSSPSGASIIARRMPAEGRVTVSERRSISRMAFHTLKPDGQDGFVVWILAHPYKEEDENEVLRRDRSWACLHAGARPGQILAQVQPRARPEGALPRGLPQL